MKFGAFAHKCTKDRLMLFVNEGQPKPGSGSSSGPQTEVLVVDDALILGGAIIVITGLGMWAAFQETEFQGGGLETAILCTSPGSSSLEECKTTESSGGEGGRDDTEDASDDSGDDDSGNEDTGNDAGSGSGQGSGGSQ